MCTHSISGANLSGETLLYELLHSFIQSRNPVAVCSHGSPDRRTGGGEQGDPSSGQTAHLSSDPKDLSRGRVSRAPARKGQPGCSVWGPCGGQGGGSGEARASSAGAQGVIRWAWGAGPASLRPTRTRALHLQGRLWWGLWGVRLMTGQGQGGEAGASGAEHLRPPSPRL